MYILIPKMTQRPNEIKLTNYNLDEDTQLSREDPHSILENKLICFSYKANHKSRQSYSVIS